MPDYNSEFQNKRDFLREILRNCTWKIFLGGRTHDDTNKFTIWRAGITGFLTKLLVKEKFVMFCRAHKQIKLIEENLHVCIYRALGIIVA
jgi:3'-phosphoadenosine 5'-phosphosulfate sulfotransferase